MRMTTITLHTVNQIQVSVEYNVMAIYGNYVYIYVTLCISASHR